MISPGEGTRHDTGDLESASRPGFAGAACSTGSVGAVGTAEFDQPTAKTDEVKERASRVASETKDALSAASRDLKDQAMAAGDELRGVATRLTGEAKSRLSEQAVARKDMVVGQVSTLSAAIRDAADRLEGECSPAAPLVRTAADRIDGIADHLRNADLRDLYNEAERFTRRHPEVVLGGLFLVGVGIARFMKASAEERRREEFAGAGELGGGYGAGRLHPTGDFAAMQPIGHYGVTPSYAVDETLDTGLPAASVGPDDFSRADEQLLGSDAGVSCPSPAAAGDLETEIDIPFDQRTPR